MTDSKKIVLEKITKLETEFEDYLSQWRKLVSDTLNEESYRGIFVTTNYTERISSIL